MKSILSTKTASTILLLLIGVLTGCRTRPTANLSLLPEEKRPIYRVQVSDSDEAGLIKQQTGIEVVRLQGSDLLFVARGRSLETLRQLDYMAEPIEPKTTFHRTVQVQKKGREEDLLTMGVRLLRREEKYWVVQGTLAQLDLLKARKYRLLPLDSEPHPRQIRVVVPQNKDIQRVAEAGVDIYSVVQTKESAITIYGGAFDYQIDTLTSNQFQVTISTDPKKEGVK
jgi:hypothetical protein